MKYILLEARSILVKDDLLPPHQAPPFHQASNQMSSMSSLQPQSMGNCLIFYLLTMEIIYNVKIRGGECMAHSDNQIPLELNIFLLLFIIYKNDKMIHIKYWGNGHSLIHNFKIDTALPFNFYGNFPS
jgi:hypothetical protein